jgi:hypothetical protein
MYSSRIPGINDQTWIWTVFHIPTTRFHSPALLWLPYFSQGTLIPIWICSVNSPTGLHIRKYLSGHHHTRLRIRLLNSRLEDIRTHTRRHRTSIVRQVPVASTPSFTREALLSSAAIKVIVSIVPLSPLFDMSLVPNKEQSQAFVSLDIVTLLIQAYCSGSGPHSLHNNYTSAISPQSLRPICTLRAGSSLRCSP